MSSRFRRNSCVVLVRRADLRFGDISQANQSRDPDRRDFLHKTQRGWESLMHSNFIFQKKQTGLATMHHPGLLAGRFSYAKWDGTGKFGTCYQWSERQTPNDVLGTDCTVVSLNRASYPKFIWGCCGPFTDNQLSPLLLYLTERKP
jgi:hypothetical protein